MNTQGWMRGLMAKNMEGDKFVEHVADCLGREFGLEVGTIKQKEMYVVKLGIYDVSIPADEAAALKSKSPYSLDKYILDQLIAKGLEFDKYRSQYIRYCYGLFYRDTEGCVY